MFSRLLSAAGCFLAFVLLLSGCVVRTYSLTKDRVDQELGTGNRGYLKGQPSQPVESERKKTRTTHVVEIELRSPLKFEKKPDEQSKAQDLPQATIEKGEFADSCGSIAEAVDSAVREESALEEGFEKYTVQKADTLQKISRKFYGTTKKWLKIYEANKTVLKTPDKVYPGQVLNIPVKKHAEHVK